MCTLHEERLVIESINIREDIMWLGNDVFVTATDFVWLQNCHCFNNDTTH